MEMCMQLALAFYLLATVWCQTPNASYLPLLEEYINEGRDGPKGYSYDPAVRPNVFSTMELQAQFYLLGIGTVDERKGKIVPSGFLVMKWVDERLKWNPDEFGNITTSVFDGNKIWSPRFMHNGDRPLPQAEAVLRADVTYNGTVSLVLSLHEEIPCRFDMTDFPKDTQNCYIQLYHPDPQVIVKATGSGVAPLSDVIERGTHRHLAWEILDVTLNTNLELSGPEDTDLFIVTIRMRRHAHFFIRTYVTPVCFVLLIIPLSFLLPSDGSSKFVYGAVLLLCTIFISDTVESIYPPFTDSSPKLIKLVTATQCVLFLSLFFTAILSSAERVSRSNQLPNWLEKYVLNGIGPLLLVKKVKDDSNDKRDEYDTDSRLYIVRSEQSVDTIGRRSSISELGDGSPALAALVNELKQTRKQSKTQDNWTNMFTVINRFLFLLTLLISIVIILCYVI